jgi:hypothetical protein
VITWNEKQRNGSTAHVFMSHKIINDIFKHEAPQKQKKRWAFKGFHCMILRNLNGPRQRENYLFLRSTDYGRKEVEIEGVFIRSAVRNVSNFHKNIWNSCYNESQQTRM